MVLKIAAETLGSQAIGLTAVGPALSKRERTAAKTIADAIGVRHVFRNSNESSDPRYRANPTNRCYFCKTELYRLAEEVRQEHRFAWIVNGTNLDDLGDHRPGLDAAAEARVRSPLAESGCSKSDVRRIAHVLQMPEWNKAASACLASRIPYGTEVTPHRLEQIEKLEDALREMGFNIVRVRHHDTVARIEFGESELSTAFDRRHEIVAAGKRAGFSYVSVDLDGYRSGSLNRVIAPEHLVRRTVDGPR